MGLIKMAALGALGYFGYKAYTQQNKEGRAAFASGQADEENFSKVRNAGPDESFPASDPPGNY